MILPSIHIDQYFYDLPEERIAKFPLANRDESQLLLYNKHGISHTRFSEIDQCIPPSSLMVWNDTRVIQARLSFHKASGAQIEVFLLEPAAPADYSLIFNTQGSCSWYCLVGNKKRWRDQSILTTSQTIKGKTIEFHAELEQDNGKESRIKLSWNPTNLSFHEIMDLFGHTPLPPYLKREALPDDKDRYQTVYALAEGSVAAPTAGLHFTPTVIDKLTHKGIQIESVTLHVGAGTFVPVKESDVRNHNMHQEVVSINKTLIFKLFEQFKDPLIAVGTTTLRSLESLFWMGCALLNRPDMSEDELHVEQWAPYQGTAIPSREDALNAILKYLSDRRLTSIRFTTRLIIVPGYRFRMVKSLITNFHQPGSTLLLLVAAFSGNHWKEIYDYAMQHGFRFLSYGDSSLLELSE